MQYDLVALSIWRWRQFLCCFKSALDLRFLTTGMWGQWGHPSERPCRFLLFCGTMPLLCEHTWASLLDNYSPHGQEPSHPWWAHPSPARPGWSRGYPFTYRVRPAKTRKTTQLNPAHVDSPQNHWYGFLCSTHFCSQKYGFRHLWHLSCLCQVQFCEKPLFLNTGMKAPQLHTSDLTWVAQLGHCGQQLRQEVAIFRSFLEAGTRRRAVKNDRSPKV